METGQQQPVYNLLIIGAGGGIGRQAVTIALEAGHRVTALVHHNPADLPVVHTRLEVVKGDILQPETFEPYLDDKDAVISAVGVRSLKPTTLYSEGNRNLLKAMNSKGTRRAFFISASAIETSPAQPFWVRLFVKYILQKLLRNVFADQRTMEKMIRESKLNWTIMRPVRLTNQSATGHYRFAVNAFLKNGFSISRADVAHFMVHNICNEVTYRTTIEIAY